MLEQLHCMMYSYTSNTVYENVGGDEEEGGGRGGVSSLSLSLLPPFLPPLRLAKLWSASRCVILFMMNSETL